MATRVSSAEALRTLEEASSMRIAARIKRIRLERSVSLEYVEAKTGLATGLVARLEKGREVPTLEMLDTLADALDVPVHRFFYDVGERELTPRLGTRFTLKEVDEACYGPATSVLLSKPKRSVFAAIKAWSGLAVRVVTRDRLLVSLRSHRASHQRDAQGSARRNAEAAEQE
jgi:transcriptional regulator with XRE-family HTH domain